MQISTTLTLLQQKSCSLEIITAISYVLQFVIFLHIYESIVLKSICNFCKQSGELNLKPISLFSFGVDFILHVAVSDIWLKCPTQTFDFRKCSESIILEFHNKTW